MMDTKEKTSPPPTAIFDNRDGLKEQSFLACNKLPENVQNDFEQAKEFLLSYAGSEDTYNVYRRELERFLQWAWFVNVTSIKEIKRKSFEPYLEFCQSPPKHWLGTQHATRFINKEGERIPNPKWRPYILTANKKKYVMSQAAWKSLFAVLSSFYQFLIDEEYTEINPVSQIRQKSQYIRKQQSKQPIRRLTELQWHYVIETAEMMANQDPSHERTLFMMSSLYGMYLRISELAGSTRWVPQMNHFHQDQDGHWWFKTVGKGNKERDISVSDSMLIALKRYRHSLGYSSLPSFNDATPLIVKSNGEPIKSTRHIRRIVQGCFDDAMQRMKTDGFAEEAEQLRAATVHWLRHTGISDDVQHRPREHVRDDAGHSSSAITDRYIDIELRQRHATARKKLIKSE